MIQTSPDLSTGGRNNTKRRDRPEAIPADDWSFVESEYLALAAEKVDSQLALAPDQSMSLNLG